MVTDHLAAGVAYPVGEFVERTSTALGIANDRVQAKYGFPCSRAARTRALVEAAAARVGDVGEVTVERFDTA